MKYARFAKVKVYDRETFEYARMDDDNIKNPSDVEPYLTALVGVLPARENSDYTRMRVLNIIDSKPEQLMMGRIPEFGEIVSSDERFFTEDLLSEDEAKLCLAKQAEFEKIRDAADWKILGSFFPEKSEDARGIYQMKEEQEWTVGAKDGVASIETAEKWVLENHPDYYMGMSASKQCPSGEFSFGAVPSVGNYPQGMWETWAGRRQYVKSQAEKMGCQLGAIEHDRKGDVINLDLGKEIYLTKDGESGYVKFQVAGMTNKNGVVYAFEIKELHNAGWLTSNSNAKFAFDKDEVGRYFSDIDNENLHLWYSLPELEQEKHLPRKEKELEATRASRLQDLESLYEDSSASRGFEL